MNWLTRLLEKYVEVKYVKVGLLLHEIDKKKDCDYVVSIPGATAKFMKNFHSLAKKLFINAIFWTFKVDY